MSHSGFLLETIVASMDDALAAAAGGADRFEVCSALALGGLTPSLGTVRAIKAAVEVPVMCMVRPREGGMHYQSGEFMAILEDARLLLEAGADGLVFGFLTPDGGVDVQRTKALLRVVGEIRSRARIQTVFHRAFDVVADPPTAIEELADLGVTRILTSGCMPQAVDGIDNIRRFIELAAGRIEILPGGGITIDEVNTILLGTGADQIHLYVTRPQQDLSTTANPRIYFGAHVPESEVEYRVVDEDGVRGIRQLIDEL